MGGYDMNFIEIIFNPNNSLSPISKLLSSTVIVGIIGFVQWRHDKNLKHITEERKAWRDDLRNIAVILQTANEDDLKKVLTALKVRINTLGYVFNKNDNSIKSLVDKLNTIANELEDINNNPNIMNNNLKRKSKKLKAKIIKFNHELENINDNLNGNLNDDYFLKDAYLWESIESLENPSIEERQEKIDNLIVEISLLLKYDWERSKNEVHTVFTPNFLSLYLAILYALFFIADIADIINYQRDFCMLIINALIYVIVYVIVLSINLRYIKNHEKSINIKDYMNWLDLKTEKRNKSNSEDKK